MYIFIIQKSLNVTERKRYKLWSQNICYQVPTQSLISSRPWTSQLTFHQGLMTSCAKWEYHYLPTSITEWAMRVTWVDVCTRVCGAYVSLASLIM